ncbi:MAG: hypothetical protein WC489_00885 [Patescibacteria group bacterium]
MKHAVILIPGLSDNANNLQFVTNNWEQKHDITPYVHVVPWTSNTENFDAKLERLIHKIDILSEKKHRVSLIGTSAGGSCVINAFCKRRSQIHKVVNVCGRLKKGTHVFPSLDFACRRSPSFKDSVLLCEKNIETLSTKDKQKIMTVSSLFDEAVPLSLMSINGAYNIRIISLEHAISIALALTLYSQKITDFLLTKNSSSFLPYS